MVLFKTWKSLRFHWRKVTFVEIVLVATIFSLMGLGVLAGYQIADQAKRKRVLADVEKYFATLTTFNLMYDAYPGDINFAFNLWPELHKECTDAKVTLDANGCNGDGNGKVAEMSEEFRAWQHLSFSGLLADPFSGMKDEQFSFISGHNVPAGSYPGTIYRFIYMRSPAHGLKTNGIMLQFPFPSNEAGIPVNEAKMFDLKVDDGKPSSGRVYGMNDDSRSCYNSEDIKGLSYITAEKDHRCRLFFVLQ